MVAKRINELAFIAYLVIKLGGKNNQLVFINDKLEREREREREREQ